PLRAAVAHQPLLGIDAQAALRRDHELLAMAIEAIAQRPAQQRLRCPEAIRLRGVEEVDAQLARGADRGDRLALVKAPPVTSQLPGPEGDRRYLEAAPSQSHVLHRCPRFLASSCSCSPPTRKGGLATHQRGPRDP